MADLDPFEQRRLVAPSAPPSGAPEDPFIARRATAPAIPGVMSPETASDVLKSVASGVVRFGTDVAGLPGDIQNSMEDLGFGKYSGKSSMPAPTSREILKKFEENVTPLHTAEGLPGKMAESVGAFAPASMLGPMRGASILERAASAGRALGFGAAVPGVASEGARELTKDTNYSAPVALGTAIMSPAISRRFVTPFPAERMRTEAADILHAEGIPLRAGQRTGSAQLRTLERELVGSDLEDPSLNHFTAAAMRRAGTPTTEATLEQGASPRVLNEAFAREGGAIGNITRRHTMPFDQQAYDELFAPPTAANPDGGSLFHYHFAVGDGAAPIVRNYVDRLQNMVAANGGHLTGEQYQNLRSQIHRDARDTLRPSMSDSTERATGHALSNFGETLDDAMERSMRAAGPQGAADADALAQHRRNYRNLSILTDAAASTRGELGGRNLITPAQLASAIKKHEGSRAYARAQGDLSELTRAGSAVLTPMPYDTALRTRIEGWIRGLGGMAGLAGGHAVGAGSEAGVEGLLAGEALAPATAATLRGAIMNPTAQRYLGNAVVPQASPAEQAARRNQSILRALEERRESERRAPPAQPPQ